VSRVPGDRREAGLRIGLSAYDMRAPDLVELARTADELGFDSLWLGEHVVLPRGYASEHPTHGETSHQHHSGPVVDLSTELLDPWAALGAAAAATSRIRLATGIYLLPLRHPLLTARAACTLQDVSGGRFVLGVGAGWLEEEFDALGVPFGDRASRLEEALAVVRRATAGGAFAHRGRHFAFDPVQVSPRPVDVPVVLGGNSDRALQRAARLGDGWFASGTPSFDDAVRWWERLTELAGRPFPTHVRIEKPDPDLVDRYRSTGFDEVIVWADQVWTGATLAARQASLARAATSLGVAGEGVRRRAPSDRTAADRDMTDTATADE
jgi:probable F420-dependent oxidoreductase